MATGMAMNSAPAMREPQKNTSPRMRSVTTPRVTIFSSESDTNVSAYTYSCITSVNANIPTVRMPGMLTGSTMRNIAPSRLQPSTRAASVISRGTFLKKPISSQVQNGIVKVGYTTTSAHRVFTRPSPTTSCDSGRNSNVGGTRYVRKIPIPSAPEPGNFVRASTYAAGTQITTVTSTTSAPTSTVFRSHWAYGVCSKRYFTWSRVGARLKTNGLFCRL